MWLLSIISYLYTLFFFNAIIINNINSKYREIRLYIGPGKIYKTKYLHKITSYPTNILRKHNHWNYIEDFRKCQGWVYTNIISKKRYGVIYDNYRSSHFNSIVPIFILPNIKTSIVGEIQLGTLIQIINTNHSWYKVKVNYLHGWIKQENVWVK